VAISDFVSLGNAVADWLARPTDTALAARFPDFVTLIEEKLYVELRAGLNEIVGTLSLTSGVYSPLPTGCLEVRNIALVGNPYITFQQVSPYVQDGLYSSGDTGNTGIYSVVANQIRMDVSVSNPPTPFTAEIIYYGWQPLSATQTTNPVILKYPSVYFYGCMAEACGYIMDWQSSEIWGQRFLTAVDKMVMSEANLQHGGGPMRMQQDFVGP